MIFLLRSENGLQEQNRQHTAAGVQGKAGIGVDIGFRAFVFLVVAADGLHDGTRGRNVGLRILLHIFQKMLLKSILIGFVFPKLDGKRIIVGIGEGIRGIVDQLAQSVIIV